MKELNEFLDEIEILLDSLDEQKEVEEKANAETTERVKALVERLQARNTSAVDETVEPEAIVADVINRENVSD